MTLSQQLFSTITSTGELVLELKQVELPQPSENEVLVKVEAAPINPSDMLSLIHIPSPRDLSTSRMPSSA